MDKLTKIIPSVNRCDRTLVLCPEKLEFELKEKKLENAECPCRLLAELLQRFSYTVKADYFFKLVKEIQYNKSYFNLQKWGTMDTRTALTTLDIVPDLNWISKSIEKGYSKVKSKIADFYKNIYRKN